MSPERSHRVRLAGAHSLTSRVRALVLEAEGPEVFAYEAGQWAMLRVPAAGGEALTRPYSLASAPGCAGPNHFEVAVGASSDPIVEALWGLRVGQGLEVAGTGGALTWRAARGGGPALLVGAGTGVAPLRALAQAAHGPGGGPPVVLLAGHRGPDDVLWGDELAAWGRAGGRVRAEVTLSRPPDGWSGRRGYVQEHVVELARALRPVDAFVCGRTSMAAEVAERLVREAGLAPEAVHVEGHG
jgi:NAD(P)H-flavin reductase